MDLPHVPIGDRGPLPHGHSSVSTPKQQRDGILTLPISKGFCDTLYPASFEVSFSNGARTPRGGTNLKLASYVVNSLKREGCVLGTFVPVEFALGVSERLQKRQQVQPLSFGKVLIEQPTALCFSRMELDGLLNVGGSAVMEKGGPSAQTP